MGKGLERKQRLEQCHSLVVKVGSAVLTTPEGLNLPLLQDLVGQLARQCKAGRRVTLVTSGAVAAGRGALRSIDVKAEGLAGKQAAAAIGQSRLMRAYEGAFAEHGLLCAQLLLTRDDLRSRSRFLNARNTFSALLQWGVVPIVNENDTVAVQELKFGDNDALASLLLNLVEGDLCVNLTSAPGVLATRPVEGEATGSVLSTIDNIQDLDIDALCGGKTTVGTGGMYSKLLSARRSAQLGVPTLIVSGKIPQVLDLVFQGQEVGTWVNPEEHPVSRRKYWLAYQTEPQGQILVDSGAAAALTEQGRSLLPGGVRGVEGNFGSGALVRIMALGEGNEAPCTLGVGLSNYSAPDLKKIMGLKRHEVAAILGDAHYPEVIHRDHLLLHAAV